MDKQVLRRIVTKDKESITYLAIFMNNGDNFSFNKGPIYDKIIFENGIMTIFSDEIEYYFNIDNINVVKIKR